MGILDAIGDVFEAIGSALESAWDAVTGLFSDKPVGSPTASCPAGCQKSVSPAKADEMFKQFKSQKDIPFDYPPDCCYSRAQEMCEIAKQNGVECRKVWNYGHDFDKGGASLRANTPNDPLGRGHVDWTYHVAPVVAVEQPDGSTKDMVMDPSMFEGPVPVETWVKAQNDPTSTTQITDDAPYFRGPGDSPYMTMKTPDEAKKQMAIHAAQRDAFKAAKGGGP